MGHVPARGLGEDGVRDIGAEVARAQRCCRCLTGRDGGWTVFLVLPKS